MLLPRLLGSLFRGEVGPCDPIIAEHSALGIKVSTFDPLYVYLWVSPGLLKEVVQGFEAVVAINDDGSVCGATDEKWL